MILPQEPFSQGESLLHRADPRAKVPAAFILALAIAVAQSLAVAAAGLALGAMLALLASLSIRPMLLRLGAANIFVLFLWLVVPFSAPGEPVLSFGPLVASHEGLRLTLLVTLKCNAILLILMALVATSPLPSVGRALQQLGVPASLCWLLLFSYRHIFVIGREYQRLARTARLRGFVPKTSLHTCRTYANLVGMTLIKSWNRAQRVHQAMLLRGFDGRFRTLDASRLRAGDLLLATGLLVVALILFLLPFSALACSRPLL